MTRLFTVAAELDPVYRRVETEFVETVGPFDYRNPFFVFKNLLEPDRERRVAIRSPQIDMVHVELICVVEVHEREARACDFVDVISETAEHAFRQQGLSGAKASGEEDHIPGAKPAAEL